MALLGSPRRDFAARTAEEMARLLAGAMEAEGTWSQNGLFQRTPPVAKLWGCLAVMLAVALASRWQEPLALWVFTTCLALASHVSLRRWLLHQSLPLLVFTTLVALPALFITPGPVLAHLPGLGWPISQSGLFSACLLVVRVQAGAAPALLLVRTTPWPLVLKSLRSLGLPEILLSILGMTHRYIYLLVHSTQELLEARRSRLVGDMPPAQARRLLTGIIGALLGRSIHLSSEVYLAMLARGFQGKLTSLQEDTRQPWRSGVLHAMVAVAAASLLTGHMIGKGP